MQLIHSKKFKYLAFSTIMGSCVFLFSIGFFAPSLIFLLTLTLAILLGSYYVHLPNSRVETILITSLLSLYLTSGVLLTFIYFPNLSTIFKGLSSLGYVTLFYIFLLVNNIFLVVDYRREMIPLYRVGLTWSKISVVLVTIPFMAGIFKLSLDFVSQSLIVSIASVFIVGYLLWVLKLSNTVKKYKVGELIALIGLTFFTVFVSSVSVAFVPTEAFLRALFISSVVMFGISYVEGHFKNLINFKLIAEHAFISAIFLLLLLLFTP